MTDTGIGIPPDELPHIAERFFRGQRSAEVAGSGIGLTIVAELVRAHRGTLDFASQPGQGTTYWSRCRWSARPGPICEGQRSHAAAARRKTSSYWHHQ